MASCFMRFSPPRARAAIYFLARFSFLSRMTEKAKEGLLAVQVAYGMFEAYY